MSDNQKWQLELAEYIRQSEPDKIEKSEAWQTAIGLQAVDGLKTSAYLLDTAKEHIEGKINIDEAQNSKKGYIRRMNGKRYGKWEILVELNKGINRMFLPKKGYAICIPKKIF